MAGNGASTIPEGKLLKEARTTTDKSQLEYWGCRDEGEDSENVYSVDLSDELA